MGCLGCPLRFSGEASFLLWKIFASFLQVFCKFFVNFLGIFVRNFEELFYKIDKNFLRYKKVRYRR